MPRKYTAQDLAQLSTEGLSAKLASPKPRKKRKNEEGEMQRNLCAWWHQFSADRGIPECLLFAIPNGSALGHGKEEYQVKQRQIRGRFMKLEGLRPGCPDLMLAVPKTKNNPDTSHNLYEYHGLFVEMKTARGIIAPEQTDFILALDASGYTVRVCRSLEEAIKTITEYLT